MIAVALAMSLATGCSSGTPVAKPPPPAAAVDEPALDGTYRLDLDGKRVLVNGKAMHAPPAPSLFAFRSACSHTGCVATGTLLQGDDPKHATNYTVVLDYVDGGWQMAAPNTFSCSDGSTSPGVVAWFVKPGPDRSLVGTYYATHAVGVDCVSAMQAPMTLNRVGDVDHGVPVADPHAVTALSASAPDGLRGRYRQVNTYRGQGAPPSNDEIELQAKAVDMMTMCVRNTEQCWALATANYDGKTVQWPMAFANGVWSVGRRASHGEDCPNQSTTEMVMHSDYPMPQPPLNPVPKLTGTESFDFHSPNTPCAGAFDYDSVLERTGS
ncbi:hypothetical protein BH09ACT8_BH09ACT8_63440 [soil metagenome]